MPLWMMDDEEDDPEGRYMNRYDTPGDLPGLFSADECGYDLNSAALDDYISRNSQLYQSLIDEGYSPDEAIYELFATLDSAWNDTAGIVNHPGTCHHRYNPDHD